MSESSTVRTPRAPRLTHRGFLWRHFARRFRETYSTTCPWDGQRRNYPRGTRHCALNMRMPSGAENARDVAELGRRCRDLHELRRRIDRMFANPSHRASGIDLGRIVNWWAVLASDEAFEARTRAVYRRGA